eukprot:4172811-Amphidinium_carterae.1
MEGQKARLKAKSWRKSTKGTSMEGSMPKSNSAKCTSGLKSTPTILISGTPSEKNIAAAAAT